MISNSYKINQPEIHNRLINKRFISYSSFKLKCYNLSLKHKLFIPVFSLYLVKFLITNNLFELVLSVLIAFLITNFVLNRISYFKNLLLNNTQSQANVASSSNSYIDQDEYINQSTTQSSSTTRIPIEQNVISAQTPPKPGCRGVNTSETSNEEANAFNQLDNLDETPSLDFSIIQSPLEPNEDSAPLEVLIGYLLTLNLIDLLLIILLLVIILDRFFYRISLEKINSFISNNKYLPNFFTKMV